MKCNVRYGLSNVVVLDLDTQQTKHPQSLEDLGSAVKEALAQPLNFPPLAQATVPGDRLAIAIDANVPCGAELVAGVLNSLLGDSIELESISLVVGGASDDEKTAELISLLPVDVKAKVEVERHDPSNSEQLAFLGASKAAKGIYINRTLFEADVVIPIGVLHLADAIGNWGVHGGLFPTFSDSATRQRFFAPSSTENAVNQRLRREEAEEAAWQLGALFTVQVVPASVDGVLHVFAGEANHVEEQGQALCHETWVTETPTRHSLVLAPIEGGPAHQTWANFSRAVHAASGAVAEGGAIVICSELATPPGPALQRLVHSERHGEGYSADDDYDAGLIDEARDGQWQNEDSEIGSETGSTTAQLRRLRSDDAVAASLLVKTLEQHHIYLLSNLDDEVVEDLGIAPIQNEDELMRLCQRAGDCLVLHCAQHAMSHTTGEA